MKIECSTTARVIKRMENRAAQGMEKFGVAMNERDDYTVVRLLRELQEELLDGAVYIEAVIERMMGL